MIANKVVNIGAFIIGCLFLMAYLISLAAGEAFGPVPGWVVPVLLILPFSLASILDSFAGGLSDE